MALRQAGGAAEGNFCRLPKITQDYRGLPRITPCGTAARRPTDHTNAFVDKTHKGVVSEMQTTIHIPALRLISGDNDSVFQLQGML